MAKFWNQAEIEMMVDRAARLDTTTALAGRYAARYLTIINENSDGWAYWSACHGPAEKLLTALDRATGGGFRAPGDPVTPDELKKALSPMKALLTRRKLPALALNHVAIVSSRRHRP